MHFSDSATITLLLRSWGDGNPDALDRLVKHAYDTIYNIAKTKMWGERKNHTLTPTALVNEAYMKLFVLKKNQIQNRVQFFALCGIIIRNILTTHARRKNQQKRGGGIRPLPLQEEHVFAYSAWELTALDHGLKDLASFDARKALVVEIRFFGGLSIQEAAQALNLSTATIKREMRVAKAWLSEYIANWKGTHGQATLAKGEPTFS